MSEVSPGEVKAAMERYPGIPATLAVAKYKLDQYMESSPVEELKPGMGWGGVHLETVGKLIQKLVNALYEQGKKGITITIEAEDFPDSWDHLWIEVKEVGPGSPRTGFAGRPCCACKEIITGDDSKASAVMLQKKAKWDYPTWGNVVDGTGKAIALVCGKCHEQNHQPEYALKLNGDDWTDLKNIELVPLSELEDVE